MRVLIAEDDPVSRRVLQATLEKWEHEVVVTSDGSEAWQELQKCSSPRMVVLDWMMPGIEGPDLCRRIRSMDAGKYFYIIMLTARSQVDDVITGLDAGADDYLVKPFDRRELRVRISCGERILNLQEQLLAARDQLAHQATFDALTELHNRKAIFDILERERARAVRENRGLSAIMLDLDHFKAINDQYGHQAGDAVLRELGGRLRDVCRAYDIPGRYGGEEFIVILCDAAQGNGAAVLAERIRETISGTPFDLGNGRALPVTASLGVATTECVPSASNDDLVHMADTALYEAKRSGRNCVVVYRESMDASASAKESGGEGFGA